MDQKTVLTTIHEATFRPDSAGIPADGRNSNHGSCVRGFSALLLIGAFACSNSTSSTFEDVGSSDSALTAEAFSGAAYAIARSSTSIELYARVASGGGTGAGGSNAVGGYTTIGPATPFSLKVYRLPDQSPLTLYDSSFLPSAKRGTVWFPATQYDAFVKAVNANTTISVSMRYDPAGRSSLKGATQFCYQSYCFAPAVYPRDRTWDLSLIGTSCLAANGSGIGSLRDDADDGTLLCLLPWDPYSRP